jgi:hypothetical protein
MVCLLSSDEVTSPNSVFMCLDAGVACTGGQGYSHSQRMKAWCMLSFSYKMVDCAFCIGYSIANAIQRQTHTHTHMCTHAHIYAQHTHINHTHVHAQGCSLGAWRCWGHGGLGCHHGSRGQACRQQVCMCSCIYIGVSMCMRI